MRRRSWVCSALLTACCALQLFLNLANAAEIAEIKVLYPSQGQCVIATSRDFYVIGSFDLKPASGDFTLSVDLHEKGVPVPVQSVGASSLDYREGVNVDYVDGKNARSWDCTPDDIRASGMPDLVYDPANPASFGRADVKCYYTQNAFSALLSTKGLEEGAYEVVVSVKMNGLIKSTSADIVIGSVSAKICARFSPQEHFDYVKSFAAPKGFRVYTDPFAGYWSTGGGTYWMEPVPAGTYKTIEIPKKLSECEAAEYATGTVHTILYNITENCATNRLEIGKLQSMGHIDKPSRAVFYHYGSNVFFDGIEPLASEGLSLKAMQAGDLLEPVRLDIVSADTAHNVIDDPGQIDTITLKAAKRWQLEKGNRYVALYGVVAPISNDKRDVSQDEDGRFIAARRIQSVSYDIKSNKRPISKDVIISTDLARSFGGGRQDVSIYEFRHVFDVDDFRREGDEWVQLDMVGLDGSGEAVSGTSDSIVIILPKAEEERTLILTKHQCDQLGQIGSFKP